MRGSDRDPQLLPPPIVIHDYWRRRRDGQSVEVIDAQVDGNGRIGVREVTTGFRYRIIPFDLGRDYDQIER